jgi:hypothetical protein
MKELESRFESLRESHPVDGDYVILCRVVKNRGYSDIMIRKAFDKFVLDCPKYSKSEKREYIDYLCQITVKISK